MAKSVRSTPGKGTSDGKDEKASEKDAPETAQPETTQPETGNAAGRTEDARPDSDTPNRAEPEETAPDNAAPDPGQSDTDETDKPSQPGADEGDTPRDDTAEAGGSDKDPTDDDAPAGETIPGDGAEPTRHPMPTPAVDVPRVARGPGFFTLLLGGVLAGAIGYAVAWYYPELLPPRDTSPDPAVVELQDRVAQQDERIAGTEARAEDLANAVAALEDEVAGIDPTAPEIAPEDLRAAVAPEIDGLSARIDDAEERIDEIAGEIASLRESLAEGGGAAAPNEAAVAEAESRLEELQSDLEAQRAAMDEALSEARARADEISDAAEARAAAIRAEAALSRLQAAVQSGSGFAAALTDLDPVLESEVPEVLTAHAEGGVPTLPELQRRFPAAARAALEAALEAQAGEGSALDRLGTFLRAQTGARSLTEREGDDPDAILSRADARLSDGDLDAALSELQALPDPGRAAMADWLEDAQVRQEALGAVDSLAASLASQ